MNLKQEKDMTIPHDKLLGKHVPAAERDPKLVFIGVPVSGELRWETAQILSYLSQNEVAGHKFIIRKLGGFGVAKARNVLLWLARQTKASKILWIDSDINCGPAQIERILSHDVDLVGGAYPKKQIPLTWVGEHIPGDYMGDLAPMLHLGTGFLLHTMKMIDEIIINFPNIAYHSDEDYGDFVKNDIFHDVFSMGVVDDTWWKTSYPRYITEDYYLSYRWRKIGGKAWLDTKCQCGHIGYADYLKLNGQLMDMTEQLNEANLKLQMALHKERIHDN